MAKSRDQAVREVGKRIVPVKEAEDFVKILVYGRNGAGKTRFAATGPKCLIVDINERGTRSVRNSGASVFHVQSWEDLTYLYWYLRQGNHKYKTVALDNLTTMQNMCMRHVLKESVDRDPNKDPAMASMREWGKLAEYLKPLLLNFRNLPMHVVFISQERQMKDGDDSDVQSVVPDMSPGSRGTAMGAVDIIGRLFQQEVRVVNRAKRKETKRWRTLMLVGPHETYITKDRTGALGRVLIEPTMDDIIKAAFSSEEDE